MSAPVKIGVLLPQREAVSRARTGAVALCAMDFRQASRFRESIAILGAEESDLDGVGYRRLDPSRRWWRRKSSAYVEAAGALCKEGLRLLEVQNRPAYLAPLRAAAPGLRLALHLHNDPQTMKGAASPVERARLLDLADAVICVSDFVRARFLEGVGGDGGKVATVPNGLRPLGAPPAKEKIVAFAGRVIAEKGAVELIRAFARFSPDHPDWTLVLAGEEHEVGFLERHVGAECAALGTRLVRLGATRHEAVMALFARAAIVAVPSVWEEPFGRSALEAMASGCALVSATSGGLGEVVGESALPVDPRDPAAFAQALSRLAQDDSLRLRMGEAALLRAGALFDLETVTARLDAIRARLLGES